LEQVNVKKQVSANNNATQFGNGTFAFSCDYDG
jgi:hypothetical protein